MWRPRLRANVLRGDATMPSNYTAYRWGAFCGLGLLRIGDPERGPIANPRSGKGACCESGLPNNPATRTDQGALRVYLPARSQRGRPLWRWGVPRSTRHRGQGRGPLLLEDYGSTRTCTDLYLYHSSGASGQRPAAGRRLWDATRPRPRVTRPPWPQPRW